jgi:hypothetical protein
MKKKILNDIKIIILILIGVTILFAILGTFKGFKENMEDPPQCYSDYHSDVKCYSDVLPSNDEDVDSTHASYSEDRDDKYILKTKIIPPKGTSCPIEISSPATKYLDGVKTATTSESETGASETGASTTGVSTTQIQNSSNLNTSNTSSSSTNITNVGTPGSNSSNTPVAADSASSTPSSVPGAGNEAIVQNTATLNEIKGSITQLNQQKPKPETCPPCPACERCPEPAFDCKKVPNYRSPSIGQYLPMPILNDFSTF